MAREIISFDSSWEYQLGENVLPAPEIPSGGWSLGSAPFGVAPTFTPPHAINTEWPRDRSLWIKKEIFTDGKNTLTITGEVENACFIYFDGDLIHSVNPDNIDVGSLESINVEVLKETATLGMHTIAVYCLDDFEDYGESDNTYIYIEATQPDGAGCQYPLDQVVSEICQRAGVEDSRLETGLLSGLVSGFKIDNSSEAYEHLLKLSEAFFFDPSNYGGKLHFKHRGSDPVIEILESDIIGDGADEKVRKMPQSIPRVLNLNYYDVDGGIDTDKQTSDRSIDTRGEDQENIDTDIVMTADFAQQLAIKKHKVIIEEQKGELDLTLPFDYIGLVVGDVVTFKNERYRCKEVNIEDGTLDVTLIYDRKSAYESNATGIPPVAPPDPISVVPGETTIEFLDTHILSSGDDSQLGFYIGISGAKPAWKGATVEISEDGGNTWLDSQQASVPAIMGELVTALGDHKKEVPDTHNTVQVQIITPNLSLESATLTEMMNRKNRAIIGNEIVSFGNVSEVSEGVWEISYLLRGRLGTDAVSHSIGERFVMLDRSFIEYYPTEKYNIGQPLTFRATSFNSSTQTTITETFTAKSQTAPKVGYLRARRIDGGQVKIDWIGTGVKGGKASVDHSQYFTGYRVDVGGTITDTTNETLTAAISGSPTTIKVYQINSFTGIGPAEEITV